MACQGSWGRLAARRGCSETEGVLILFGILKPYWLAEYDSVTIQPQEQPRPLPPLKGTPAGTEVLFSRAPLNHVQPVKSPCIGIVKLRPSTTPSWNPFSGIHLKIHLDVNRECCILT